MTVAEAIKALAELPADAPLLRHSCEGESGLYVEISDIGLDWLRKSSREPETYFVLVN